MKRSTSFFLTASFLVLAGCARGELSALWPSAPGEVFHARPAPYPLVAQKPEQQGYSLPSPRAFSAAPPPVPQTIPAQTISAQRHEDMMLARAAAPVPSVGRRIEIPAHPRRNTAPVAKPAVYAPFPRHKPAHPGSPQPAGVATARASTLTIQAPSYSADMVAGPGGTPPMIEYHIPHLPQEEALWCWAAAAQQAIGWVNGGRAPAQCAIVALAHNIPVDECCADKKGICAKTGEIPAIGALVRRFGGQAAETVVVPRDPMEIYSILKSGGTLLVRLRPEPHEQAAGIRHMIVVRGIEWLRLPNGQLSATLHYNDPLGEGQRSVDFNEIVGFFEQALIVRRSI